MDRHLCDLGAVSRETIIGHCWHPEGHLTKTAPVLLVKSRVLGIYVLAILQAMLISVIALI